MYFVYILFSYSLNKYYVGHSGHPQIRLEEHNRGKSPFTKKGIPWKLIHQIESEIKPSRINKPEHLSKQYALKVYKKYSRVYFQWLQIE